MGAREVINDILVRLINEIWQLEEKALITGEFRDLTSKDLHVIEAIGLEGKRNMSSIAKKLNVTVSTLTTAVNGLVRKNYVERCRNDKDRRVVLVNLTEKGVRAYHHHEEYHSQMTQAVLDKLTEDEIPVLVKTLDGLSEFFRDYGLGIVEKEKKYGQEKDGQHTQ